MEKLAIHTVKYQYGPGEGVTVVQCGEHDDLDTVRAKVTKKEMLNYLPMNEVKVKIIHTQIYPQ